MNCFKRAHTLYTILQYVLILYNMERDQSLKQNERLRTYGHRINIKMGYDNIVLNSMSRFYHEKLNANFRQYCTRMGNGKLGMTARNGGGGVRMGVGDGKMMEVLIESCLL